MKQKHFRVLQVFRQQLDDISLLVHFSNTLTLPKFSAEEVGLPENTTRTVQVLQVEL